MTYRGNMSLDSTQHHRGVTARKFAELGLPNLVQRQSMKHPHCPGQMRGVQKWKTLARRLPKMEEALCAWEAQNQAAYRASPWFEAREAFKAQKAAGAVVWPTWWEIAGAAANAGLAMTKYVQTKQSKRRSKAL